MPSEIDFRPRQGGTVGRFDGRGDSADRPNGVAPLAERAEVVLRMPATIQAPRRARRLVADALAAWGRQDLCDSALLVVSELTANAVRYGGGDLTVALAREGRVLRIAVGDTSAAEPVVQAIDSRAGGGRGLQLIAALTHEWGYTYRDGGKVVWARLAWDDARSN